MAFIIKEKESIFCKKLRLEIGNHMLFVTIKKFYEEKGKNLVQ
jgi:hypothetical protein